MKSRQAATRSRYLILCAIAIYLTALVQASGKTGQCAPSTWQPGEFQNRASSTQASTSSSGASSSVPSASGVVPKAPVPVIISPLITTGNITAGEINCRYVVATEYMEINCSTCAKIAERYQTSLGAFFKLNPKLDFNCGNIRPHTDYFIEPLRARDGLCGPLHKNATCLGTEFQCCNGNTFTCGNTFADYAPRTCYEGACPGDAIFTTTGECGRQHANKRCAGVWGDCCNAEGQCGTGPSFCGKGVCQLGNCTVPVVPPAPPSWFNGNTTDGTCGGFNAYTCSRAYGNCCNKNGICGSLAAGCGQGW
ncbi:Chitin- type 1 protein [Rutstroemia sp. NJR-2017a WRK4]|nr:Chitin- type 1 protein [Rutstroemia sp. NJR-2017a WRK4]